MIAQSSEYAKEAQNLLRDKARPIGTGTTMQKPRVLAIQEDLQEDLAMGNLDALVLNAVDRAFKKRNFNPGNSNNNRNQNRFGPALGAKP